MIIYCRLVVHIIGTIKQRMNTQKTVSHNSLQNRCLHTTTRIIGVAVA